MTDFETERLELERLVAAGRERAGPPSPRQDMIARALEPSAWTDAAQEHVDWCVRHGLSRSATHFGAQHIVSRRLAAIRAAELGRALDRQAAGLPDAGRFDARGTSKALEARWWETTRADPRAHPSRRAAEAVFHMRRADGIPAPTASMADDGSVALVWSEGGRTARVDLATDGSATLTLEPSAGGPVPIDLQGWRPDGPRALTAATDWVHFDGPEPSRRETAAPARAA